MSEIAALDRLGDQLGTALRRELPAIRRRRRTLLAASLLSIAIAVPAAGAATNWAGLAGGETALPTQVRPELRATVAGGRDAGGRWRVEAYRAAIGGRGSTVGVCVFASRRDGGGGRCVPDDGLGPLTVASGGDVGFAGVAGGVARGDVTRVEVTLQSYERPRARTVVAVTPGRAPRAALRARDLPEDLRPFVVLFTRFASQAVGMRALDEAGRTLAVSGRPAAAAPAARARPSPITAPEVRP
ncbi:MAG: hypothetical protein Q8O56_05790 [Solirubrobacteraceae bacterium]|nr:hypothetical protein [Solirubrobacteraceae bacterium]